MSRPNYGTRVRSTIPTYTGDARPAHLQTAQELDAQGLRPGTATPDALWNYQTPDTSGTCGLYDLQRAEPTEAGA